jgi:hypothetical protein
MNQGKAYRFFALNFIEQRTIRTCCPEFYRFFKITLSPLRTIRRVCHG